MESHKFSQSTNSYIRITVNSAFMAAGMALSFCDDCADDGPMMLFVKTCCWPAGGNDGGNEVDEEWGSFRDAKLLDGADIGPSMLPPPGAPRPSPKEVLGTEAAVGPPTTAPAPPRPLPRGREGGTP